MPAHGLQNWEDLQYAFSHFERLLASTRRQRAVIMEIHNCVSTVSRKKSGFLLTDLGRHRNLSSLRKRKRQRDLSVRMGTSFGKSKKNFPVPTTRSTMFGAM